MSIKKFIHIQGTSQSSFDDAIKTALLETSKSIDNIEKIIIANSYCTVKENNILEYIVDIDVCFVVDLERIHK